MMLVSSGKVELTIVQKMTEKVKKTENEENFNM